MQVPTYELNVNDFDLEQNKIYSDKDSKKVETRGGKQYFPPSEGWRRFGLKSKGKYEDGDDWILGKGDKGWTVGYFGFDLPDIIAKLLQQGAHPNDVEGIYVT